MSRTIIDHAQSCVIEYKRAAFPQDASFISNPLWQSMKQPLSVTTCPGPDDELLADSGICFLKCAIQRCNTCPNDLPLLPTENKRWTSESLSDEDFLVWKEYEGRYFCLQHGQIGKKSKCQLCVENPNQKPDKDPQRKIHYCRKRAPIGDFIHDHLKKFLDDYRYHLFLVIVLGKNWCIKYRLENYHKVQGSVFIIRDYADKLAV